MKSKIRRRSSMLTSTFSPFPQQSLFDDDTNVELKQDGVLWAFPIFVLALGVLFTSAALYRFSHVAPIASALRNSDLDSKDDTIPASMGAKDVSQAKFIAIRGERHSATNLFRQITNKNGKFQQPCIHHNDLERCDAYLGWKHGFLDPKRDVMDDDVIMAVMVRDVFSWLVSMFYEPYNMIMNEGTDNFGTFLRSNYDAICELSGYVANCSFPMEQADNLVNLRTKKYRNWIDFLTPSRNETRKYRWSVIRQEDLVGLLNQKQTSQAFFREHFIRNRSSKFKVIGKIVTNSMQSNQVAGVEILRHYTVEELKFVLNNLDLDFERETLGYDYQYVNDHIDQRVKGATSYTGPPALSRKMLQKRLQHIKDNLEGRIPGRDISMEDATKRLYAMRQKIAFQ
ncbi:hypothetical protein HJC23_003551 [Cyclotella cryptica]|uniref:Sulfotransferase n=1 Tax=Cyclotella cryptica TaxID=29204 RepID=A0ABD3PJ71_9STRA|eukprot:CCRYP_014190-RA/>CCRYP_014190-RA protein AED:0.29 eAED:0.29 QI:0/-1/0/1/-1/1/1/0/397